MTFAKYSMSFEKYSWSIFQNSCTPKRENSKRYSPYSPTNRETPVCRGFAPCSPSPHTHPDTHHRPHHRPHHHAISLQRLTVLPDRQIPTSVTSLVSTRVSMWVSISFSQSLYLSAFQPCRVSMVSDFSNLQKK